MNEEEKVLYELSTMLMTNEKREAEAVEGYNEQLKLIARAREFESEELAAFLDKLEAATKEKISDELNHVESLYREYVEMTGILPAKD
jgi:hypothetical protein